MRILLLVDYWAGYEITKYLKEKGENIVGLGIHPSRMENHLNKGYTKMIVDLLDLPEDKIFQADDIQSGKDLQRIKELNPDIVLAIYWGFILKPELINIPPKGCINIHLAYLPYNRGKNPNIWAIVEGTPAGVTMHYIDPGIDTGEIISRVEVPVESIDTGETVYDKIVKESVELFKQTWPQIIQGSGKKTKQELNEGTFHYAKDLRKLDQIDPNKKYKASDLIDLLRARTFPPFPSAYFVDKRGKKVYARLQLEYAEEK